MDRTEQDTAEVSGFVVGMAGFLPQDMVTTCAAAGAKAKAAKRAAQEAHGRLPISLAADQILNEALHVSNESQGKGFSLGKITFFIGNKKVFP